MGALRHRYRRSVLPIPSPMSIYQFEDRTPEIDPTAFIFETAVLIGRVRVRAKANIWGGVIIRGDNELIDVGEGSNVQECSVLHTDPGFPLTIDRNVSVGHQAMLHGCTVGEGSLIGIQAIVLNGARIGRNCLVGAGALITEGKVFADNSLIIGSPAKVARVLDDASIARLHDIAAKYVERGAAYKIGLTRIG